jgi:hypothetical protein
LKWVDDGQAKGKVLLSFDEPAEPAEDTATA